MGVVDERGFLLKLDNGHISTHHQLKYKINIGHYKPNMHFSLKVSHPKYLLLTNKVNFMVKFDTPGLL